MGLAAYGKPSYYDDLKKLVTLLPGGQFRLDLDYFIHHLGLARWYSNRFEEVFGTPREAREDVLQARFCDLASSAQRVAETIALHLAEALGCATASRDICLGGGVALNAVLNQKVLDSGRFNQLFVGPAPNDAGSALGAALNVQRKVLGTVFRPRLRSAALGPQYTDAEIESCFRASGLAYKHCEDPAVLAASNLARGKIVGWFQGRMEFGPRALGNRSILAPPAPMSLRSKINDTIKFRHAFRPFGASVKNEAFSQFFDLAHESPFMMQVCQVKPVMRELLSAVTHVDGSCRPQTVAREDNPLFWQLLDHFERDYGLPIVLNTSFNLAGEPIVCSPLDAVSSFVAGGIDLLVAGSWVVYGPFCQR